MNWVPLVDYYQGSKYQALDQFLLKIGLFVPLGVLPVICLRGFEGPSAGLLVLLAGLVAALAIELGQCFLPNRFPGITDVLLEGFGAWLGYLLARHVQSSLRAETTPGLGTIPFLREAPVSG
jgi:glycopeptide antibiotics resistance protein